MPPPSYYPCAWEVSVESVWPPWEWRVGANTGSGMVLSYWKWLHHNPNNRAVHPDVATLAQLLVSQLCADSLCSTLNELEVRECNLWVVCWFTACSLAFFLPAEFLHSNIFPLHLGFLNLKSACICFFSGNNDKSQFPHIIVTLSIIIASCSMCVFFGNALCTEYCQSFHLIWECFLWLFCSCTMHLKRCHWWSLFTAVLLPFCGLGKHSGTNSEALCYFLKSPVVSVPGMTTN